LRVNLCGRLVAISGILSIMILITHIVIALASIGLATFAFISPSVRSLRGAYISAALTLTSGIYLVVSAPAHMVQACISGVIYLSIVTVAIMAARSKLAARASSSHYS
jgi:hypothetical protein